MVTPAEQMNTDLPLCIDLDGTLIRTDLLIESLLVALRKAPWIVFQLPFWLLRGKQFLKQELAARSSIDATGLPYVDGVVELIGKAREAGRRTVLVTGSHESFASQVADHLAVFDEVIATNVERNLTGRTKARVLDEKFQVGGYEYVANEAADMAIWRSAGAAVTVNAPSSVVSSVAALGKPHSNLPGPRASLRTWLKAIRIRQWVKNALLFVPLMTAHRVLDLEPVAAGLLAFVCFGLCASSTYLINDLFDLQADRKHHKKRFRPLAAGSIEPKAGLIGAAVLMLAGLALTVLLPFGFKVSLAAYLVGTLLYSFSFKQVASLDVITLAGLYTLRIIAGAFAIGVTLSFWLLAFSMFIFLSLAMVKRVAELIEMQKKEEATGTTLGFIRGREYDTGDIWVLTALGASSGYLSVLVLAFYIQADEVSLLYRTPEILWLMAPLMLIWVTRLWVVTARGYMDEDPIYFAVKDPETWITTAISVAILVAATYLGF